VGNYTLEVQPERTATPRSTRAIGTINPFANDLLAAIFVFFIDEIVCHKLTHLPAFFTGLMGTMKVQIGSKLLKCFHAFKITFHPESLKCLMRGSSKIIF
jgi:hypothetical protein